MGTVSQFQESNDLPTLRLWELGPTRHAFVEIAVGDEPEELSRRGTFNFCARQGGRRAYSLHVIAMALRAILSVEFLASGRSLGIARIRILHLSGRGRSIVESLGGSRIDHQCQSQRS